MHILTKAVGLHNTYRLTSESKEAREALLNELEERALIERMAVKATMLEDTTELGRLVREYHDSFRFDIRVKLMDYRVEAAALQVLLIDGPSSDIEKVKAELETIQESIKAVEKRLPRIPANAIQVYIRLMSYSNIKN